jgi:uncharacterized repeat protein (TIGR03803 family)
MAMISEAKWKAKRCEEPGRWLARTTRFGIAAAVFLILAVFPLQAQTEKVLYSFTGAVESGPDGANPGANLLRDAAGNLYGTTQFGGTSGNGTVFELVNSNGSYTEKVLYSFEGSTVNDGTLPLAGLVIDSSGNLYGTASGGGAFNAGIVFELVNSNGSYTEKVLHSFASGGDGQGPQAGLVMDSHGNLFGTTVVGGASDSGAVFELVNSSGNYTETVVHSFTDANGDGGFPYANLIVDSKGNLYGTTSLGGASNVGTVFELVNSSGSYTETVLYSFTGANGDGRGPIVGLVRDSSGNLYGTTQFGGPSTACGTKLGCGVVFELAFSNGSYTETVLHTFTGLQGNDGGTPLGLVMDSAGSLYGVTEIGGTSDTSNTCVYGCGTVYELLSSSSYTETVLYSFPTFAGDGLVPDAALVLDSANNLYGITSSGGFTTGPSSGGGQTACPSGCGTVFEFTASPAAFAQYSTIGPINFGPVNVGSNATQQLTLTNNGGASFAVDSISFSGSSSAFALTNAVCNGVTDFPFTVAVTLAPRQTCTFTLQFAPTITGTGQGELLTVATTTTNSNASAGAGGAGQAFLLAGDGVEPFASYSPLQLSFGNVPLNTHGTQTVTVTDTGTGPLVLQLTKISPLGTGFSSTQVVCNGAAEPSPTPFPLTISPGNSCTFTVQFDPSASGVASGGLGFADNAGVGESNLTSTSINGSSFQQVVPYSGTGVVSTVATTTSFTTSSSFHGQTLPTGEALVGNPITVSVTVKPASGTAVPAGSVLVTDGGLGDTCSPSPTPLTTSGTGTCTLTIATFPVGGQTSLSAAYTPATGSGFLASNSLAATEQVVEGVVPCNGDIAPVTIQQKASVKATFTVCLAGNLNFGAGPVTVRILECLPFARCTITVTPIPGEPGVYTVSVTMTTSDAGNGTASSPVFLPRRGPGPWPLPFAGFGALLAMLTAMQLGRQNRARPRLLYAAGLLFAMVLSGMSACGGGSNQQITPLGLYTVNVQVAAGGTFTATVPLNVTVTK